MNAKLRYRLLSALVALCMVLVLFPAAAMAEEGPVAQIGDTTYDTFAAAAAAVQDGQTIELLQDCESGLTGPWAVNKNVTVTGNYTVTFDYYSFGIHGANTLTLDGCHIVINNAGHTAYSDRVNNAAIMLDQGATLTLDNAATLVINTPEGDGIATWDVVADNTTETLNILNGSSYVLNDSPGGGIEDYNTGSANVDVNVSNGSTMSVYNSYSGFIGTLDVTIDGSKVNVINSSGNGSNGSNFYISNGSVVTFEGNGSHGLSANDLTIESSSVVNAVDNGYYGAYSKAAFLVDGTSTLNVTGNSYGGDFAGLKLAGGVTSGLVEEGAVVTITGNYCSGLSNNGKVVFEEGAELTIMNNVNDKGTTSNGGGVYNTGSSANLTLPSDAVIYNNHAVTGGDDIYNSGTITFGKVGDRWALDGDPDCEHRIDGWYVDSADARWEAHADTEAGEVNHIELYDQFGENATVTVSETLALKAAHGENAQDKTSYPGLDKVIVTDDGDVEEDTAAAGGTVNFKLTTNVPDDLRNYIIPDVDDPTKGEVNLMADVPLEDRGKYILTIHDQMDDELVLDLESFVVMIGDTELALMDEYTIAYDVSHNEDGTCDFEITLDLVDLYKMGVITDEDIENATPITVTYTATLKEEVTAGAYLNTAWVTYPEGESQKDTVTVKTYGIDIFKYDQAIGVDGENAGLANAVFALYGEDDVTVAEDGTVTVNEGADPILTVTSGENGHVIINGLDEGIYYLVETKAPEGYVQSTTPLKVTIPDDADETTYLVNVNFANAQVPHTGGAGTLMYTIGGAAIILLAGALLLVSRHTRKKQAG